MDKVEKFFDEVHLNAIEPKSLVLRRVYGQLAVYNTIKWPVESGFGRSSDERLR